MSSKGKPPGKRKPTPKAKPAPKHDPTTTPRRAGAAAGGSRPQPQQRRRLSATERARRQRRQRLRATASILAAVLVVAVAVGLVVQRKQADAQALRTLGVQTFPNLGQRHLQSGSATPMLASSAGSSACSASMARRRGCHVPTTADAKVPVITDPPGLSDAQAA